MAMDTMCGIDEAGRGPLAGPVTAGAVVLPGTFDYTILDDSKRLSEKKREAAYLDIVANAVAWGLGWVWPEEIDAINIHNASLLAMQRAYFDMGSPATRVQVDGKFTPTLPVPVTAIIGGDGSVYEIMAASILAKVSRDRWMIRYSWVEPEYGFDRHKGYPTKAHRKVCAEKGLSPIHRKSFTVRWP